MAHDVVADALNMLRNAKKARREVVRIKIISNLLIEVLKIMKQKGAVKKYKIDPKDKSLEVTLGSFNECRAVKPRFSCNKLQIERYKRKISGPIIDRIDIWTEVSKVDHEKLTEKAERSESIPMRDRIVKARNIQEKRFKDANRKIATNSEMSARDITLILKISDEVKEILNKSAKTLDLSARSYHKIIKLARTIADLDSSFEITPSHILEAISYRPKQSQY